MKTNTNQTTRSANNAHEGQTVAGSNQSKQYEVVLHFTQYNYATVIVKATSPEEAEEKAEAAEIEKWTQADGDLYVYSIDPVSERGSHD